MQEHYDSPVGGAAATADAAEPSSQPSLHDGVNPAGLLSAGGGLQAKGRKRAAPVDLDAIEDRDERRKEQHRMRNRANAAASRARRMQYVSNLEQRLRDTDEEIGRLHSQLAQQDEEISRLKIALAAATGRGQGGSHDGSPRATPCTNPAGEPPRLSAPGKAGEGAKASRGQGFSPFDRRGAAPGGAVPAVPGGAAVPAGAAVEPRAAADLPAVEAEAAAAAPRPLRFPEGRGRGTPALVAVAPVAREVGPASAGDSASKAGTSVAVSHALGSEAAGLLPQQQPQPQPCHQPQQRQQLQRRVVEGLQQEQQQWQRRRQRHTQQLQQLQRLQAEQLLHDLHPQPAFAPALELLPASAAPSAGYLAPAAAPPSLAATMPSLAPPTAAAAHFPGPAATAAHAAAGPLPPSPTPATAGDALAAWAQVPLDNTRQPAGLSEAGQRGAHHSLVAWLAGAQPSLQGFRPHMDVPSPVDASGAGGLLPPLDTAAAGAAGLIPPAHRGHVAAGLQHTSTVKQLNPVQLAQLLQIHDSPLAAAGASAASRAVAAALGSAAWPFSLAGVHPAGGLQPGQGLVTTGLQQTTEARAGLAGNVLGLLPGMVELSTQQPVTPSSRPESGGAVPAAGDCRDARASPSPSTAGAAQQGRPQRPPEQGAAAAASHRAAAWQQQQLADFAYFGAACAPGQAAVKEGGHEVGRGGAGMEAAMSLGAADGVAEALLDLAWQGLGT
ncbi:hypothetical protein N2152v2_000787 [Parachlorella kessleri]